MLAAEQACKLVFSAAVLQPMGSYPRVADKKGAHDLFGPVSKIYCSDYDRAMTLYLACLKVPPLTLSQAHSHSVCLACND